MTNGNSAPFLGGFLMGSWGSVSLLDNITVFLNMSQSEILTYYSVKLLATLVLGVVGGLAGMVAKDLYRIIKMKIFKK